MRLKFLTAIYVLVLAAIIYMADHKEFESIFAPIKVIPYHDKMGHFFLMGLLSFVVNMSFRRTRVKISSVRILKGSLIVAFFVTLEEFSQLFISFRSFDAGDLLFDYLGIFIFGELAFYLASRKALTPDETR